MPKFPVESDSKVSGGSEENAFFMRRLKNNLTIESAEGEDKCRIRDSGNDQVFEFGALECYLIHLIYQQISADEIVSRWNQDFGTQNTVDDLEEFLDILDGWGLLEPAFASEGHSQAQSDAASHQAGAEGFDSATHRRENWHGKHTEAPLSQATKQPHRWHLFEPEGLLDFLCRGLCPLRKLVWLTPFIFVFGIFCVLFNLHLIKHDLAQAITDFGLFGRIILAAFTINLVSQLLKGLVARHHGLRVPSFGAALAFGLIPSFNFQITQDDNLSREGRLWLSSSATLGRMVLFSLSMLLWLTTRASGSQLSMLGAELAFLSVLGLLLVANPLWDGDGRNFLSVWSGTPDIKGRSMNAFRAIFFPPPKIIKRYTRHSYWFVIYAVLSFAFLVFFIGFIGIAVALRLEEQFHGAGVALFLSIAAYVIWSIRRQKRAARQAVTNMNQAAQPNEIPRPTVVHTSSPGVRQQSRAESGGSKWARRGKKLFRYSMLLLFILVMFLPYRYDPGGEATILAVARHEVNAETEGLVEEVNYTGGEWLEKGTIIARLADHRQRKDVKTTEAAIEVKRRELQVLRTTPSADEIRLAKEQIATAQFQMRYSSEEAKRVQQLYEKGTVSVQVYEDAQKVAGLDRQTVSEREASLVSLKAQVNPNQIEAVEHEIAGLLEQLEFYKEQLRRTELRMPIDGHITASNLGNLRNTYMEEGDLLTEVEDSSRMRVEIAVPEADISYITVGDPVELKIWAYTGRVFTGEVTEIGLVATEASYGRVIKVVSIFDNEDGLIKSEMTGFAKVEGSVMPVFLAFTQALSRFFRVEFWSWIP